MKTHPDALLPETVQLSHHHWRLEITPQTPTIFRLYFEDKLAFRGQLELFNNHQKIETSDFHWQFRTKTNRIEQWCNQQPVHLSLGMTYSFQSNALVIEYMARHRVPTRLELRHHIEGFPPVATMSEQSKTESLDHVDRLRHRYHEQPSDYLSPTGSQRFKEAFSATQWIVLSNPSVLTPH